MKDSLDSSSNLASQVETAMRELSNQYARGIVGEAIDYHLATGGKRIRARLALDAFEALGGRDISSIVYWAASCELLHNGTLVHDDIQDGDRVRRNSPTVWVKFGVAQAINVGDMMLMLPVLATEKMKVSTEIRYALAFETINQTSQTVRGQAAELLLPEILTSAILQDRYRTCIEQKTGSLFELPVFGSALLAGRSADQARRMSSAFTALGRLFQVQDDVLDLYGAKGREELGADLKEGKVSALVVEHLRLFPQDAEEMRRLLTTARDQVDASQVSHWIERFQTGGALEACCQIVERLSTEILDSKLIVEEPALGQLLVGLVEKIRSPIAHVLTQRKDR